MFFFLYIWVQGEMRNSISSIIKEEKICFKTNDTKTEISDDNGIAFYSKSKLST